MTDLADRTPSFGEQLKRRKPIAAQTGPHVGPELERSFGTFQLMLFGVGATVGTGIFFVLQEAVPDAGPAVIVAACVLLEYVVSSAAVAVGWSGYINELLQNLFGFHLPDALSYSPVPFEENTTGLVNLPAVVLVMLCMVLLLRGASKSARVNTVMVLIKLSVLVMFVVIGLTAYRTDHFGDF